MVTLAGSCACWVPDMLCSTAEGQLTPCLLLLLLLGCELHISEKQVPLNVIFNGIRKRKRKRALSVVSLSLPVYSTCSAVVRGLAYCSDISISNKYSDSTFPRM